MCGCKTIGTLLRKLFLQTPKYDGSVKMRQPKPEWQILELWIRKKYTKFYTPDALEEHIREAQCIFLEQKQKQDDVSFKLCWLQGRRKFSPPEQVADAFMGAVHYDQYVSEDGDPWDPTLAVVPRTLNNEKRFDLAERITAYIMKIAPEAVTWGRALKMFRDQSDLDLRDYKGTDYARFYHFLGDLRKEPPPLLQLAREEFRAEIEALHAEG